MIRLFAIVCYLLAFTGFIFLGLFTMRVMNKGMKRFNIKDK